MKQYKECQICGTNIAKYSCKLCCAFVCENCYNKIKGICINCQQGIHS